QGGEELSPVDVAQAGQLGDVPAQAQDAVPVKAVRIDACVLGMDVYDVFAEFPDCAAIIDVLPDQVRRVEIETEVRAWNLLEQGLPDGRGHGQVVPARPFILAEQHRAIPDAHGNTFVFPMANNVRPDRAQQIPVFLNGLPGIATNERVDNANAKPGSGADYLAHMIDDLPAMFLLRMQGIGVITQARD